MGGEVRGEEVRGEEEWVGEGRRGDREERMEKRRWGTGKKRVEKSRHGKGKQGVKSGEVTEEGGIGRVDKEEGREGAAKEVR